MGERFDAWVARGPFTPADLGRYRVVYATVVLACLVDVQWVAAYPDSLYQPPVGPFALLHGFPPLACFRVVELLLAVALTALLIGWCTRVASVAVAVLLVAGWGFDFSLGVIEHTVFLAITPVVLAFARWGDAASVDAWRRRHHPAGQATPQTPQWAMRCLALLVAGGFATAAVPKLLAGWLSPSSQVLHGVVLHEYYGERRDHLLASAVLGVHSRLVWEADDWAVVLLECSVVVAVVRWRSFRAVLALLAVFHLGVWLTVNIDFWWNVLAYGAFVSWSRVPLPRWARPLDRLLARASRRGAMVSAAVVSVGGGAAVWALTQAVGNAEPVLGPVVLVCGAGLGAWHVERRARSAWSAALPAPWRPADRGAQS